MFARFVSIAIGFVAALNLISCSQPPNEESARLDNIFGTDDRQAITSRDAPWRMIGYIDGCTGTLVGRDLVLTAAHCVMDPDTHALRTDLGKFQPNRIGGTSLEESAVQWVWWGTDNPSGDGNRKNDWALLRLEQPLGDIYGWMGTRTIDFGSQLPYQISLAGYSGDFQNQNTAGVHIGCHIKESFSNGMQYHDCDDTRGSSGGPVFTMFENQPYIVAVNVSEFRDGGETSLTLRAYEREHANISIWQRAIADKINEVKDTRASNYISLYATPTGSYYGWGRAATEAQADAYARQGCSDGGCIKVSAGKDLCAALVKQNTPNGGWNWATAAGLKGAITTATTNCERYSGVGGCSTKIEVCAGIQ